MTVWEHERQRKKAARASLVSEGEWSEEARTELHVRDDGRRANDESLDADDLVDIYDERASAVCAIVQREPTHLED